MSTILYKFKSSTTFDTISLPGTSARLFDVKRAIVRANKLDRSTGGGMQLEFDISVKNAMTDEEYGDENMLLPRGTRIVVQRLPAAKGQGLLARIARADAGMASGKMASYGNVAAADNGFYTIQSAANDDDEFVDTNVNTIHMNEQQPQETAEANNLNSEEKELAALRAVTDQAGSMYRSNNTLSRASQPSKFAPTGSSAPSSSASGGPNSSGFKPPSHTPYHSSHNTHSRPNADPELREQERLLAQQSQPAGKRRATGIPRTFLNIPPPAQAADGDNDDQDPDATGTTTTGSNQIKLQPNDIAFQALVNRGGGQSTSTTGSKRRDLDYALKLTATEIPEHLQCGICAQVVKNAMLIPWDMEGRTACEMCMRDGLAKNGFRCPLTGQDGVSPDDLIVNMGLRKAADMFVKDVMDKMDEIIQQQEADEEQEREKAARDALLEIQSNTKKKSRMEYEGTSLDKGMVVKGKEKYSKIKKQTDDDFGGEDDFGGDVFDVEEEEDEDEDDEDIIMMQEEEQGGGGVVPMKAKAKTAAASTGDKDSSSQVTDNIIRKTETTRKNGTNGETTVTTAEADNNTTEKVMTNVTSAQSNANTTNHHDGTNDSGGASAALVDLAAAAAATPSKKDDDSLSVSTGASRRELIRNRAPPAGYSMGPAGSVGMNRNESDGNGSQSPSQSRSQHGGYGGRGRGRGGGRYNNYYDQSGGGTGRGGFRGSRGSTGNFRGRGRGRYQQHQNYNQGRGGGYDGGGSGRGGYQPQHLQKQVSSWRSRSTTRLLFL